MSANENSFKPPRTLGNTINDRLGVHGIRKVTLRGLGGLRSTMTLRPTIEGDWTTACYH